MAGTGDDFYAVLGVPRGSDADAIKKAYRKLAKDLHPDKNPGNKQAETRFKAVNRAFDTLNDPKKRALYDEFGEEGLREGFDAEKMRARCARTRTGSAKAACPATAAKSASRISSVTTRTAANTKAAAGSTSASSSVGRAAAGRCPGATTRPT